MASLLFKEMKGLNFSCTSPASTAAICATIDGSSLISSAGAGRAIDRYNPHLRDPRRTKPAGKPPALLPPQLPPSSKTKKKMKKTNNKSSEKPNRTNFATINNNTSSSPGSSTRFLLNSDVTLSHDHVFAEPEFLSVSSLDKDHEPSSSSSSSSSLASIITTATSTSAASTVTATDHATSDHAVVQAENQVVVLRVSLHCKGCEGKVRKHISKMEGVKSFFIDFGAKKVTVIGDVTPLGVLNSISKVKSAQFWPSPGDSSS